MKAEERVARAIRSPLARRLQSTRAGIASRLAANAVDLVVAFAIFVGVLAAVGIVRYLLTSDRLEIADPGAPLSGALQIAVLGIYLFSGWAGTGRTVGKSLLGLRLVTSRGGRVGPGRALARVVVCLVIGGPLLLWAVISRRNAALYDRFLRTAVIYDWSRE